MLQLFYPKEYFVSVYGISFRKYRSMGYGTVLFDVDNTLVEHDAPANRAASELMIRLYQMGYSVGFLSNNDEQRVRDFCLDLRAAVREATGAEDTETRFIYIYKAGKPLAKGYRAAMERLGAKRKETLFVGDQLFTDIWGANNAGVRSVLVKPIAKHEEIQIVLKRIPERLILHCYLKKHRLRGQTDGEKRSAE